LTGFCIHRLHPRPQELLSVYPIASSHEESPQQETHPMLSDATAH
jgi:hypothetical protein